MINSLSNKDSFEGRGRGDDLKTALLIELPKGCDLLLGIDESSFLLTLQFRIFTASTAPLLA